MDKANANRIKTIYIVAFFLLNILNSFFLSSSSILDDFSPFPRTIFMVINSFFSDFGFLLIFLGFAIIIFKKDYSRAKFLMISSIIISIIYFASSVFFQHYNMFFSFYNLSAFSTDAGGDVFRFIIDSLLMLLTKAKFIFLLPAFFIIILFIRKFRRNKNNKEFYNSSLVVGRDRVIIGAGLCIVGILIMASGLSAYRVHIEDTWYEDNYTPLHGVQTVGFFNYYIFEGYTYFTKGFDAINQKKYELTVERLEEYKNPANISPLNDEYYEASKYEGIFADKNLLLIQLESFNNFVIGLEIEIDGEYIELTPNINKIVNKSIYFDNFYTSVGIGNTSDSEFTVLTGLYPIENEIIINNYNRVQYQTLPNLFKEAGYYTFSAHANTGKFYSREKNHQEMFGFDAHYGKENLEINNDLLLHTWLNDYDFLSQSLDIFYEESLTKQVYAHLITITCHMPYLKPAEATQENWFFEKPNIFPSNFELVSNPLLNQQILGYLEHISYTDYAIGGFLEKLEELGLNENTIIGFYGDHGSYLDTFEMFYQNSRKLRNQINPQMVESPADLQNRALQNRLFEANIPFIIYDPASEPLINQEKISLTRGTNTICRTFVELFNLNPEYYFGIDALTDVPTYVYNPKNLDIYADGIIISGQSLEYYIYDDNYRKYYDQDKINDILEAFLSYKDFNDKLIKYEVFPQLE